MGRCREGGGAGSGVDGRGRGGKEGEGQEESQLSDVVNSSHAVADRDVYRNIL